VTRRARTRNARAPSREHQEKAPMPESSATSTSPVYYDPYAVEIAADPYPVFRRLRAEAPLYYNEKYDFYALSRYDDVERGLLDHETYISGRGPIIEMIQAKVPIPPGTLITEDPPIHTIRRNLVSKVFTPRKMAALEPQIREFCARCLDPLVGAGGFDFVRDFSSRMPVRVIGMLLGIPEPDQDAVREHADARLRTRAGEPMRYSDKSFDSYEIFGQYIEWRVEHPSHDLMTELLHAEFVDETGAKRRMSLPEVTLFTNILASAGSETTTRLLGWAAKLLAEHPDQRRELVRDPSRIPNAIEEVLRFEPPAPHIARCVARDVRHYGTNVPAGAPIQFLVGSANRDERRFEDGERFDIHRKIGQHLSFGFGIHFCLGAALARLEARVALEELLKRFPEWDVDLANAKLASTSTVRGWETLPISTR
jgi:cytochrome P450